METILWIAIIIKIAILAIFLVPFFLLLFSLNAHFTAAEYTAKTALKKDAQDEEQEYQDLRGLYEMWYTGKMLIIWSWRLFCKVIWFVPPLFLLFPKPKPVFTENDVKISETDDIPLDKKSWFFKIYRGLKGYEKGYFAVSIAHLLTHKSKISKGLGAAALTSVGVRKKRETERKKLESERDQREAEERAEQENLARLRKMEDDLRIRAYPDEVPPVIEGDGESRE